MTERALIQRAESLGVSASYLDWRKLRVEVPSRTLAAIVDALGDPPPVDPAASAAGFPAPSPAGSLAGVPAAGPADWPAWPGSRPWALPVQPHSVRSPRSWGHGDRRDLGDLAGRP